MAAAVSEQVERLSKWVKANPGSALLASNAATAGVFLYVLAQRYGGVLPAVKEAVFGAVSAVRGVPVEVASWRVVLTAS